MRIKDTRKRQKKNTDYSSLKKKRGNSFLSARRKLQKEGKTHRYLTLYKNIYNLQCANMSNVFFFIDKLHFSFSFIETEFKNMSESKWKFSS